MKKTFYLHIGGSKTGSTSFQQSLHLNNGILQEKDLFVPSQFNHQGCHNDIVFYNDDAWQAIFAEFANSNYRAGVISSELITAKVGIENTFRNLESAALEQELLFVARNPMEVLLSHYSDRVCQFGDSLELDEYIQDRLLYLFPSYRYPQFMDSFKSYDLNLDKFGEKFANLNCKKIVIIYDNRVNENLFKQLNIDFTPSFDFSNTSVRISTLFYIKRVIENLNNSYSGKLNSLNRTAIARWISQEILTIQIGPKVMDVGLPKELINSLSFKKNSIQALKNNFGWKIFGDQDLNFELARNAIPMKEWNSLGQEGADAISITHKMDEKIKTIAELFDL